MRPKKIISLTKFYLSSIFARPWSIFEVSTPQQAGECSDLKSNRAVNRDLKPFQINNFRKGELIDEESNEDGFDGIGTMLSSVVLYALGVWRRRRWRTSRCTGKCRSCRRPSRRTGSQPHCSRGL